MRLFAPCLLLGCSGPGTAVIPTPTSDTGPTVQPDDPRVTLSGRIDCPDPGTRPATPLLRTVVGDEWATTGDLTNGGRGIAVADYDGDGHLDIFVPRHTFASRMLFGDGSGGFVDRADEVIPGPVMDAFGASAADPDGDGDFDLIVYRATSEVTMLINDGTGNFVPQLHPEWEPDVFGCGGAAAWADADLDGDLDLFYGRLGRYDEAADVLHECRSAFLLGDGAGGFTDASDQLSADVQHLRVMAAGWHDTDDDPWPELYVITDLPEVLDGNRLLDNDAGGLSEVLGTGLEADLAGMGIGAGDLNDDGLVDFIVPGIDEIAVLQSSGPGSWVDWSAALQIVPDKPSGQEVAWGGEVVDLDNDGLVDVPMAYGTIPRSGVAAQPDEIYRNTGSSFERVGAAWGFDDPASTRGFIVADLDRNGWLDLVVREMGGPVSIYRAQCGDAHWLGVELRGLAPNVYAIGARIEVDAGGRTQWRTIAAGSTSFNSGGPPEQHFGLGELDAVQAMRVTWPDGTVTTHPGVAADQWVTITYGPDER